MMCNKNLQFLILGPTCNCTPWIALHHLLWAKGLRLSGEIPQEDLDREVILTIFRVWSSARSRSSRETGSTFSKAPQLTCTCAGLSINISCFLIIGISTTFNVVRNYIYEDAFDKLSPDNEANLRLKMRVQLVNAAGERDVLSKMLIRF